MSASVVGMIDVGNMVNRHDGRAQAGPYDARSEVLSAMKNSVVQRTQHPMYEPISIIRGLDETTRDTLLHAGIKYTHQLLERGGTEQQRMELARQTGISLTTINMLITRTDLMRLRGVGGDLSQLLERSGVNSCRALQTWVPEQLYKRLAETHIRHCIAYHAPTLAQVRSWINEAKHLAETSPL